MSHLVEGTRRTIWFVFFATLPRRGDFKVRFKIIFVGIGDRSERVSVHLAVFFVDVCQILRVNSAHC